MAEQNILKEMFFDGEDLTEKQRQIIIAAIESFSEKGFAATSTSEIAKKAGVAEGTIFRHYKTKKELLLSIVSPVMSKLISPFIMKDLYKVIDQRYEKYEDFLRAMIYNRKEFLIKNLPVLKIMVQEIPFHDELREQFKEHVAKEIYQRMSKFVEHYKQKGEIIEMPTFSIIRFTATSIIGHVLARYVFFPEANWDDEAEIDRTIHFIMHGLAAKQ
ncbi:DNA-binding transcriptional regulator, AcrR family [Evansella caseinilytica]|uniref:DNA-binding transcriptional regulator, AcrR family n=1 Tax=Evansella caseinilytica TaxID=1503961 RepID=A0A1H3Q8X8_9BACI|nr:TetR/AcrR family transcriptional regulator [Evansella caseinilytica]SDZ09856.1 DNA-binding transcriptional regulator, AcrR family [Evansella caseinilytica]